MDGWKGGYKKGVSNLVFYAQSTITVLSGRWKEGREGKRMKRREGTKEDRNEGQKEVGM